MSSIPGIVQHCLSRCHPQNFCQRSFKAVVIMISAKCQHPGSEKSKRAPMPMMPNAILLTLHIIVRHNHHHPNWTMASIPDIVEHKASVTFRRPRSVRSQPDTASQVRPSCALIILRFITHYHSTSPPCDIISYQQTSVSASADICRPNKICPGQEFDDL